MNGVRTKRISARVRPGAGGRLTGATLALLLLASPSLAGGGFRLGIGDPGDGGGTFRLGLETSFHNQSSVLPAAAAADAGEPAGASRATLSPPVDGRWAVSALPALAAAQEQAAAPKPRRSWIRRYWWVPVVAAVAVGLALQDDSPDAEDPAPG